MTPIAQFLKSHPYTPTTLAAQLDYSKDQVLRMARGDIKTPRVVVLALETLKASQRPASGRS